MLKSVFALALLAATVSGAAMARESKTKQMNDAEMDKVTAGQGFGNSTACSAGGTCNSPAANHNRAWHANVSVSPGSGRNTR
jgi:hypothetical protein